MSVCQSLVRRHLPNQHHKKRQKRRQRKKNNGPLLQLRIPESDGGRYYLQILTDLLLLTRWRRNAARWMCFIFFLLTYLLLQYSPTSDLRITIIHHPSSIVVHHHHHHHLLHSSPLRAPLKLPSHLRAQSRPSPSEALAGEPDEAASGNSFHVASNPFTSSLLTNGCRLSSSLFRYYHRDSF